MRITNTVQQLRRPFCIADAAFVASPCTTAFLGSTPSLPLDALSGYAPCARLRRHLTALDRCVTPRLHPPHGTTTFPSAIRIRSTRSGRSPYPPPPGSASRPPRPSSPHSRPPAWPLYLLSTSIPMRSIIAYAGSSLPPCPTVLGATAGG
ncbi:hypothetical protein B0H14DRAFT_2829258 [Mycena olivaceomarginata]|nr:hypothetical protein B0H14DRAFT_2836941 [Mycena olivaceomarginata]KAJ7822200.1 hypothetical protein B0H14DRAFT_2829258 [Mycena olivaceomarginata]